MSTETAEAPKRRRARLPKAIVVVCAVLGLLMGAALVATRYGVLLPQTRLLIEARTDGLKLGRFGRLKLYGLSGDVWRNFSVRRLTISDEKGVWLDARDVQVEWDYSQLFFRRLLADEITAKSVQLVRRPTLEPSTKSPGMPLSVDIDAFSARVELLPAFSYERGVYDLTGEVELGRRNSGQSGRIEADSVLRPGDHLDVRFEFGGRRPLKVAARALEAEGGALAGALGLPTDQPFALQVDANGKMSEGRFSAAATSGTASPLQAHGAWNPQGGQAAGRLVLTASTLTQGYANAFGPEATFSVTGRKAGGSLFDLVAEAKAENLLVSARGLGNLGERRTGPQGWTISAQTPLAARIIPFPPMGAMRASGVLTGEWETWKLVGNASAEDANVLDYIAERASGPVTVTRKNQIIAIETKLAIAGGRSENLLGPLLGPTPKAEVALERLGDGRWLVRDLKADGTGLNITGSGGIGLLGNLSFKGRAQVTNLPAARIGASGVVNAEWRATRDRGETSPWLFDVDAKGQRFASGFAELDRILGASPTLNGKASWRDGLFSVAQARLNGAKGRADFAGVLGPETNLAFKGDWSADGPFRAGPVEITGAAKGTGAVGGTLLTPRVDVVANAEAVDLPQLPLRDARIVLSFLSRPDGSSGTIAVTAASEHGPAKGSAAFRFPRGGVDLTDVAVDAGGIRATGALSLRRNTPSSADLQLAVGPGILLDRGEVAGRVRLVDSAGGRGDFDLTARGAVPKGARFSIARGRITGQGPLSRLPYTVEATGASTSGRWTLNGQGTLADSGPGYTLTLAGAGKLGDRELRTAEPAVFGFGGPAQTARVRLATSGGGLLNVDARLDETAADLRAQLTRLDLQLFNEDLAGRINGVLALRGRGDRLDGVLDAKLEDARGRGSDPVQGLDGSLLARLSDNQLTIDADAGNAQGLRAAAHVVLPAEASASPLRLALNRRRPISGQFQANGEIRPLWDLLIGGERTLSGRVSTQGTLSGTLADPKARGKGAVDAGRFEDAVTGLTLQDVVLRADFTNAGIDVTQMSGRGPEGGAVQGSGNISLTRNGESSFRLDLKSFRLIDNEMATASASGQATINRAADGRVRLAGALTIDRADIAADPPTPSGVVTLDVIERNKPEDLDEPFDIRPRQGPAIALDVTLKGPRRVFLRGRGLDVEFSLDAHVAGTTARPQLTGTARVVRGGYEFAGKRFEFDDRGVVYLASSAEGIRLDLTAVREDPALTAEVRIRGTAAEPEITLTSRPVLPNDEVLSQVLFGRSASQLSPLEAAQLASALSALAGGGGFDVIGGLRTFAGLDRLALVGGDESGVMVAGGKYLTEDVYLEIIGGGRQGPAAQVEWRVSRNLSVLSRLTGQGDSRLAVRWRRDY
ncbi:translocation/assembly module TamB domain-containing protein [Phenylobacterium sp.]|uniref:translocation/assembly module TamB domain-containing protein n=1 Tax=Phenylobacterium sp. TaxID=1871053 RepID=UPI002E30F789|nr:translocation/assembly module TamB domain-containing protein [Phenylobacterium sp.]HEX2562212.1 translocation/assembly module TamB domain-containing protein [Phenylobacterium sp.]